VTENLERDLTLDAFRAWEAKPDRHYY